MPDAFALFECLYQERQTVSEKSFTPLRIHNRHPERRELQAYVEAYRQGRHRAAEKTGLFSPKFALKTHLTVAQFRQFALQHADADICLVNPFPQLRYWSYNVWMQGEHAHPGLLSRAQALLDAVGLDIDLRSVPRHGAELLAYSNFWVATPAFWEAYIGGWLVPISDFLDRHPDHPAVVAILQGTDHTQAAPFLPFMVERLLSSWLSLHPDWRVAAYPIEASAVREQYCLSRFERLLFDQMRDEVDRCDRNGHFPDETLWRMNGMCALYQQHCFDYYVHQPHPHTGQVVKRLVHPSDQSFPPPR
ncbi:MULTISPECIES: hypothetical protein [Hydrogenophaga]|uniref:Uncharacterized protein n=1 Tax=Hydrogenophaga electricum TaxID=1230953 RepID=A0ABQ6C0N8_9BURK|nr:MULTISPECIES: hypothetical protein [Hydrogenophaga]GLS13886.1 hypothetical protein GCM10007935_13160 [Hydrogenophaga electricum]